MLELTIYDPNNDNGDRRYPWKNDDSDMVTADGICYRSSLSMDEGEIDYNEWHRESRERIIADPEGYVREEYARYRDSAYSDNEQLPLVLNNFWGYFAPRSNGNYARHRRVLNDKYDNAWNDLLVEFPREVVWLMQILNVDESMENQENRHKINLMFVRMAAFLLKRGVPFMRLNK